MAGRELFEPIPSGPLLRLLRIPTGACMGPAAEKWAGAPFVISFFYSVFASNDKCPSRNCKRQSLDSMLQEPERPPCICPQLGGFGCTIFFCASAVLGTWTFIWTAATFCCSAPSPPFHLPLRLNRRGQFRDKHWHSPMRALTADSQKNEKRGLSSDPYLLTALWSNAPTRKGRG